jgi:C4-dicarboxylate-specific signal transduction histidine kinase
MAASYHKNGLRLHDNGSGISPANSNKIFTPVFITRRNSGGTGLGLEITPSLLKAYGGKIELAKRAGCFVRAEVAAKFFVGL